MTEAETDRATATGGTYKELDVKLHVLFLLKTDWIESNSFLVRSIQPDCFSALAALTPKGGGQGQDKTIFHDRGASLIGSPVDLNFFMGQSSLPCTYGGLTVAGRPCRSLWHSMMSAGHSASGTSPCGGFIATHGPDRRFVPQATSTKPPGH